MFIKQSKMKLLKKFENQKFKLKKKSNQRQKQLPLKGSTLLTNNKITE